MLDSPPCHKGQFCGKGEDRSMALCASASGWVQGLDLLPPLPWQRGLC